MSVMWTKKHLPQWGSGHWRDHKQATTIGFSPARRQIRALTACLVPRVRKTSFRDHSQGAARTRVEGFAETIDHEVIIAANQMGPDPPRNRD